MINELSWNYISKDNKSTGYEDKIDVFKICHEIYKDCDDNRKNKIINRLFNIYRSRNIFPITYYNEQGIKDEIKKCINKNLNNIHRSELKNRFNQGKSLCRFLFPNFFKVSIRGTKNNSMWDRFHDDKKLYNALKLGIKYEIPRSILLLRTLRLIGGGIPSNFSPMRAKQIYEHFAKPNGIIYDFSMGFGGRMIGCLSSKNNYTYIGVDPCAETFKSLNILGEYIEKTTNRIKSYSIYKDCSENFEADAPIDLAFSSPPYFDLEKYSDEDSQCYNKFNNINDWINYYIIPTFSNINKMLKGNGKLIINISNYKGANGKIIEIEQSIIESAHKSGFRYIDTIKMILQARRGVGFEDKQNKFEPIYVFKKTSKEHSR